MIRNILEKNKENYGKAHENEERNNKKYFIAKVNKVKESINKVLVKIKD